MQKELDQRMSEVVKRIRKETKDKLKAVVKEATQRLDVDTAQLFEQALHSIVQHRDNGTPAASDSIAATPTSVASTKAKPSTQPKAATLSNNGRASKTSSATKAAAPAAKPAATAPARRSRPSRAKVAPKPVAAANLDTATDNPATATDSQ
ncbi:hypothetical protein [Hymenobacter telluris]|uniref:hypothetical protein n=1 Tax=Hymenobacter telluris TaxID=2816474 RepID=UPI001A8C95CB|nr:hypothetical protein [Hymenobacter telluris]